MSSDRLRSKFAWAGLCLSVALVVSRSRAQTIFEVLPYRRCRSSIESIGVWLRMHNLRLHATVRVVRVRTCFEQNPPE